MKSWNSSFWFDNWTGQGALYYGENDTAEKKKLKVGDFEEIGVWNRNKLRSKVSGDMVKYIV